MSDRIDYGQIPGPVLELCRALEGGGHEAHLVGGGVRDMLMGRPVHDWDVATSARPDQVQGLFRRCIPTGIKHGTVTVLKGRGEDELPIEVTTYRGEGAYSDGRRPDEIRFVTSLEEDLSRRDFTINAMALDPLRRRLVDPLGGQQDLERRVIRAVGEAAERFGEDGLRIMRAVRFAAVLEMHLEQETEDAIGPAIPVFRKVSRERVRDELLKLLEAPRPSVGLEIMRRTGLLGEVLPELVKGVGLTQNRHHPHDVYRHTIIVVDSAPADPLLRMAALLHDVGKPATAADNPNRPGEKSFHGHEKVGARMADDICGQLRMSNRDRARVVGLVQNHNFRLDGWTDRSVRRFLARVEPALLPDLLRLKRADVLGKGGDPERLQRLDELKARLEAERDRAPALHTRDLALSGGRLIAHLGLKPGPRVGEILRELLERVLDDPSLNEEEALLGMAEELNSDDSA